MALVSLEDAKAYLRIDTADEDALINSLLVSACRLCADVARLTDDSWNEIDADPAEEDTRELQGNRAMLRVAILFALGYLFEHREEANHDDLTLTLRSLLYAVREGGLH